jgi:hypothetical protein
MVNDFRDHMCETCVGQLPDTALDWNNGFWSVNLKERSKQYTDIITPLRPIEMIGIKNS